MDVSACTKPILKQVASFCLAKPRHEVRLVEAARYIRPRIGRFGI